MVVLPFLVVISIHTPARGVTEYKVSRQMERIISIHTPARGVTWYSGKAYIYDNDFNPHSRTGSDFVLTQRPFIWPNFNPHSRTGSDPGRNACCLVCRISIHTPARGVTVFGLTTITLDANFNPHSRTGSDLLPCLFLFLINISIHTPARGVTIVTSPVFASMRFQSTLPHGE